jgi:hypothetical protein
MLGLTGLSPIVLPLDRDDEVAGSDRVAPAYFRNEPFGEHVEGRSHREMMD